MTIKKLSNPPKGDGRIEKEYKDSSEFIEKFFSFLKDRNKQRIKNWRYAKL